MELTKEEILKILKILKFLKETIEIREGDIKREREAKCKKVE